MTIISRGTKVADSHGVAGKTREDSSRQRVRRKLSLRRYIKRQLGKVLKSRLSGRVSLVILAMLAFLQISHTNDVFAPRQEVDNLASHPGRTSNIVQSSVRMTDATADKPDLTKPNSLSVSKYAHATTIGIQTSRPTARSVTTAKVERSVSNTATYTVDEGGSLWRAGKRFIDDDALLVSLIDNLAEGGMNVRTVRPGEAFVVRDLGNEGIHVVIENGNSIYNSHILEGVVRTSVLKDTDEGFNASGT